MTRSEKLCEGSLSTSLLDESARSDAAQTFIIDRNQIATTVQRKIAKRRHGGSWVEPLPITEKDRAGTWIERPQSISLCNRCVFVGWRHLKHTPSPCSTFEMT